jgi:hypothetical protein
LARSICLGFLGAWPFGFKDPRLDVLDSLGFPWILSFESRLFNGLRGFLREEFFLGLFRGLKRRRCRGAWVEAMRKRKNGHGVKLNPISDFLQSIVARAVAFRPPRSKRRTLGLSGLMLQPPRDISSSAARRNCPECQSARVPECQSACASAIFWPEWECA